MVYKSLAVNSGLLGDKKSIQKSLQMWVDEFPEDEAECETIASRYS
jgi:hypothetical protein